MATGARKARRKFGALFGSYGSVTVEDAKKVRKGIEVDVSTPERAAAQPKWCVHRKWIEELYDVRSKSVHEGTSIGRSWGWEPAEHLIMAAWVFPLVVKLLLERDGHYTLSERDEDHCLTVDKLLTVTDWHKEEDDKRRSRWQEIMSSTVWERNSERIAQQFLKENP